MSLRAPNLSFRCNDFFTAPKLAVEFSPFSFCKQAGKYVGNLVQAQRQVVPIPAFAAPKLAVEFSP